MNLDLIILLKNLYGLKEQLMLDFNYFNADNGTTSSADMIKSALLQLNGHDRMKRKKELISDVFNCLIMPVLMDKHLNLNGWLLLLSIWT